MIMTKKVDVKQEKGSHLGDIQQNGFEQISTLTPVNWL